MQPPSFGATAGWAGAATVPWGQCRVPWSFLALTTSCLTLLPFPGSWGDLEQTQMSTQLLLSVPCRSHLFGWQLLHQ